MPYSTGQFPLVGDIVSDKTARVGTVTRIVHYGSAPPELVIDWEDGTIGIRYSCLEAFIAYLSRAMVYRQGLVHVPA